MTRTPFFPAFAQSPVDLSGLAYIDYNYVLASPDSGEAGSNGFTYRRLYLTADYRLDDSFSGRARVEVSNSSTTAQGRPSPFIKDLYVTWSNALGHGHHLTLGVTAPPSFTVSERFWGFRSLEATIMDRNRIVSSRDFGIVASGPLEASRRFRYAVMFADNEGVNQERDKDKRLYGQLEWHQPDGRAVATAGIDYAGYTGELDRGVNFPVFLGVDLERFRLGAEAFYNRITFDAGGDEVFAGLSVFGLVRLTTRWNGVARYDRFSTEIGSNRSHADYAIIGLEFHPNPNVHIMPNFEFTRSAANADMLVNGRLTVHVDFGT
ncbi:MAG: hypothetical protein R2834_06575 [Rhodothermales bacterium]